jgi:energy-coupling factor transporter ATP-binding protein EcfA2
MAQGVLIIGESGSGKSTAGRNLNHEETFWINVANKSLPFKGWKTKYPKLSKENPEGRMSTVNSPMDIIRCLEYIDAKRKDIKTVIIDDWQYMSAFEFFARADERGYDKFTDIGKWLAEVAKKPIDLRDDLTIFFLTHAEESQDQKGKRKTKAKTIGRMVDEKLTLEGLFSIVLYAKIKHAEDGSLKYVFETVNDGSNTCKAPMDMFVNDEIPNDLAFVQDQIIKYES